MGGLLGGAPLLRDIAIRGATTGAGALLAWQIDRVTGTRRRASTIALAALVGTQLGQTLLIGGRNPSCSPPGSAPPAALAGLIQTVAQQVRHSRYPPILTAHPNPVGSACLLA